MKNICLVFVILLISACGNQPIRPDKQQYQGLEKAHYYYQQKEYKNAVQAFTQLYTKYRKDDFAIYLADSYLQLKDYQQAKQYYSLVKNSKSPLYKLIQAELYIYDDRYNFKLDNIEGQLRPRYLVLQAKIDSYHNNHINAALALIELSSLDSSYDVTNSIIVNLLQLTEKQLVAALFNLETTELQQGWLEAATITLAQDDESVEQWRARWQNHPASQMFNLTNNYKNVAVLLPLTGKYEKISESIQQGMMAALYRNASSRQQLTFFDTGSNGESFSYAWYGAIESGADFIIGPLEKNSIAQLVQINSSTVPVMLLNELEQENNPFGFYQFSLSKEDEVRNVANRLWQEKRKRIMLLAPETNSGRKLARYFEQEFNSIGGQVVSYAFYPEAAHDYSREIKQAIGLNDSTVRARNLKTIIGEKFKNTAQIRPDVDAIFILAKNKNARLIKPQLKFYQAENVPVYSTSQIQGNNAEHNKDLNGIKFCQSQFVIDSDSLENKVNFDTTKIESNKKFFAFGFDAIAMFPRLEWMQRMQNQQLEGLSGQLTVDGNGKVHRDLSWAQYQRGRAVLLPPIKLDSILDVEPPIKVVNQ